MTIRELRRGIEIFSKYMKDDEFIGGAEHDVLCIAPIDLEISEEDTKTLEGLGFHKSKQHEGWICFC